MINLKIVPLEERIVLDAAAAAVIYVNAKAAPGGHGTSWTDAFNNLQDALNLATSEAHAGAASETIWVAKGTYTPGNTNTATFNLPNNLSIYGGFSGTEHSLSQRNVALNATILSGDLLRNDISIPVGPSDLNYDSQLTSPAYLSYLASKGDNSIHVVTAVNGVKDTLDGLTISNGFANGSAHPNDQGGALLVESGSIITLNHDILTNNASGYNGGAIQEDGSGTTLTITNSKLTNNLTISPVSDATHGGGALSIMNGALATITNTLFSNNQAGEDGGAVRLGSGSANLSNDSFISNHARRSSGALASLDIFNPQLTTINIDHTLFQNNTSNSFAGAVFAVNIFGNTNSSININNSDFIANNGAILGGAIATGSRDVHIQNSNFVDNTALGSGGAIYNSSTFNAFFGIPVISTITVDHSNFVNNTVTVSPLYDPFVNLISNTFFGGPTLSSQGGGAITNWANLNVSNSTFVNNSVHGGGDGGAILNGGQITESLFGPIGFSANAMINSSVFVGNTADNNGGAFAALSQVSLTTPGVPTLTLTNSVLAHNKATNDGGGIYANGSVVTATHNLFVADAASSGRGVDATNSIINTHASNTSDAYTSLIQTNVFILDDIVLM